MPHCDSQGVRIYYEVAGEGPALVLLHGFVCSTAEWHEAGYVDGLRDRYRLILLDSRGHGRSDKPHDPALYEMKLRAYDIVAVLDALGLERAHVLGYSMGGRIGLDLAWHAPERLRSLIVGGSHPYGQQPDDGARRMFDDGMAAWIDGLPVRPGAIAPSVRARMLAEDTQALRAALVDRPALDAMLPALTIPCLAYVGEHDAGRALVEEFIRLVPNGASFVVPGRDHWDAMYYAAEQVLPRIRRFLAEAD